jgi:hypothetical protein
VLSEDGKWGFLLSDYSVPSRYSNRPFNKQLMHVATAIEDAMDENTFVVNAVNDAIGFPVNFEILPDVNPFEFRGNMATVGKFFKGKAG